MMSLAQRASDQTMSHGPCSLIKPQPAIIQGGAEKRPVNPSSDLEQHGMINTPGTAGGEDTFYDTQKKQSTMIKMSRTHTLQSLSGSSTSSDESSLMREPAMQLDADFATFGMDLRRETQNSAEVPAFDKGMRRAIERHMRRARLLRERARNQTSLSVHSSIASSAGVPYVKLRSERPFLYDIHTYPMHEILASTLGVEDLSKLHEEGDLDTLMEPLRSSGGRFQFHEAYDNFVTSFCIPLLHSLGMSANIFHSIPENCTTVSYRYQAFPNIRILRPGDTSEGPRCDTTSGHSVGSLHFHVPLTPTYGTNALYTESHPGREDWHPLVAKSLGLGFLFDGARCLHFNMENTTEATSVVLDFVVAIYGGEARQEGYGDGECLCNGAVLEDRFSLAGPGYYDEAIVNVGLNSPILQIAAKKHGQTLLDPDSRVGFPFA